MRIHCATFVTFAHAVTSPCLTEAAISEVNSELETHNHIGAHGVSHWQLRLREIEFRFILGSLDRSGHEGSSGDLVGVPRS